MTSTPPPSGQPWHGAAAQPHGAPLAPPRPSPLPWLALAFGIASPAATLLSGLDGLVGLSRSMGLPGWSTAAAWTLGIAGVVLGIVALARRQRPALPAILGLVLPIVGHAVLLGLWVLVVVVVMAAASGG